MDLAITPPTAQAQYPQPGPARDQRQPMTWDTMESLPDEFIEPIREVAARSTVWVYLLPGDRVGVEVLNAPLRKHHKALRIPAENRA